MERLTELLRFLPVALCILASCATPKIEPPTIDPPPTAPLPPSAPRAPRYALPKATDVDWRSLWSSDFANDSQPTEAPPSLGNVALVASKDLGPKSRTALISSLLAAGIPTTDYGVLSSAAVVLDRRHDLSGMSLQRPSPQLSRLSSEARLELNIQNAIGRLATAAGAHDERVNTVFVVTSYSFSRDSREVVKLDVPRELQKLDAYNEKAARYNAELQAYRASRQQYEASHRDYLREHTTWRDAMEARFADAKQRQLAALGGVPPAQPITLPPLDKPTPLAGDNEPGSAPMLSLQEMRDMIKQIAREAVPAQVVELTGQFIDAGSGETVGTVDAALRVPEADGMTEAAQLRELVRRIRQ